MLDSTSTEHARNPPAPLGGAGETLDQGGPWTLRGAGLRVTAARLAVLEAVREGEHWTTDQIATRARAKLGSLSTQAVYDALAALGRAGLVRRMEPAGSPARFETRVGDNHHHLVCRNCGAVADVACAVGAAPCLTPSDAAGFLVDEADVTFWGICPACQARDDAGSTRQRAERGLGAPSSELATSTARQAANISRDENQRQLEDQTA